MKFGISEMVKVGEKSKLHKLGEANAVADAIHMAHGLAQARSGRDITIHVIRRSDRGCTSSYGVICLLCSSPQSWRRDVEKALVSAPDKERALQQRAAEAKAQTALIRSFVIPDDGDSISAMRDAQHPFWSAYRRGDTLAAEAARIALGWQRRDKLGRPITAETRAEAALAGMQGARA